MTTLKRFIAHPPGTQNADTKRQFDELQTVLGSTQALVELLEENGGGSGPEPGDPVEIVRADADAGWQVWGDVLIQWGQGVTSQNTNTVVHTFVQPFKSGTIPAVTCQTQDASTGNGPRSVVGVLATNLNFTARGVGNQNSYGLLMNWIAVGEAPDDLKKPKVIAGGSGGSSQVKIVNEGDGYQIVGGKLIQWGVKLNDDGGGLGTVVFPIEFASTPAVTTAIDNQQANVFTTSVSVITTSSFNVFGYRVDNSSVEVRPINWIAIGDAPAGMAMPTEISVIGTPIREFLDPNGEFSWRIVGSTLEMWGTITFAGGAADQSIFYPKTFADTNYTVTVTPEFDTATATFGYMAWARSKTVNSTLIGRRRTNNGTVGTTSVPVQYHAIGKWDGVG